jgi:protein tyrosine/serine phosphatase
VVIFLEIETKMTRKIVPAILSTLFLAFTLAIPASATKNGDHKSFDSINISNFGQMDERFFRGGQPKAGDYRSLSALGIKTIIDLRDDPTSYEKSASEAVGMHYVNIPMSDKDYPTEGEISQFMAVVNDPATGKFFVHCAGGRHRTGVMGAVYRFNQYHWNFDQVYNEMKSYDFYTRFGHGNMKKYVEDYWQRIQTNGYPGSKALATAAVTAN